MGPGGLNYQDPKSQTQDHGFSLTDPSTHPRLPWLLLPGFREGSKTKPDKSSFKSSFGLLRDKLH